jgi:O-acetyl-ADP-ribose deacetylase
MLDEKLCRALEAYLKDNYIDIQEHYCCLCAPTIGSKGISNEQCDKLLLEDTWPEFIPEPDSDTFSTKLFHLINQRGLEDVDVYKRANIDRKLFSKLRKKDYHPSKKTVIALALALQLNLDEATDLLRYAEYALSPNDKADTIIKFCFTKPVYELMTVNELLYQYANTTL